jgi:Zn-dependent M28 family amino/carboxypeptidase
MVSFGPHPAGSPAQAQVADYIESELVLYDLQIYRDTFESVTPIGRRTFHNIWGELKGEQESVIILATHFDSKYFTDFVFVGANDGGSSSAVILELARVLSETGAGPHTLWFVFFDGEEAFRTWTGADSLYGSRHFVRRLARRRELDRVKALVLLDLIGGQDVRFRRDLNSTPWLTSLFWETAAEMGHSDIFSPLGSTSAVDDHLPFAEQGIPVVDIIDLENYPYWHREGDTPDKLSPTNLQIVGNVVLATLPKISARLNRVPVP